MVRFAKANLPRTAMLRLIESRPALGVGADRMAPFHPRYNRAKRNQSCPCGSGRKFKDCCIGVAR